MYYILSGCIYTCKYTSITMISFQQNRPIQTLQKLFHSEGSTYTNTIKKTTTTDFKGFQGFERWRVWKIQELYKVRENGTKDPLKVIMTECDWSSSRQELPKFFLKEGSWGGGTTGQDRTLYFLLILSTKYLYPFKLKIHRGFPKVISDYDNN